MAQHNTFRELKTTLGHVRNYFGANISTKALAFVSIPVLTRLLSTADYGTVNVYNTYVGLFAILLTLNLHQGIGRYYYEDAGDFKAFFGSISNTLPVVVGIGVTLLLVFKGTLADLFQLPDPLYYLLILSASCEILINVYFQLAIARRQSAKLSVLLTIRAYVSFGLSWIMLVVLQMPKYVLVVGAYLVVTIASSIYVVIQLRGEYSPVIQRKHLRYSLRFSLPLLPYALSGLILVQFDRIMINSLDGAGDAGLYSFAYNIGMIVELFAASVNSAWIPRYYEHMNAGNTESHDKEILGLVRIVLIAAVGMIYFGKEIGMLLARKNYYAALPLVPIIVVSYVAFFLSNIYSRGISYVKKTMYLSGTIVISGAANVLLNALFLPRYGYVAAAWTTLCSYSIMLLLSYVVAKYVLKVHCTSPLRLLLPVTIFLLFVASYYLIEWLNLTIVPLLGLKLLVVSAFACIMIGKSFLRRRSETEILRTE